MNPKPQRNKRRRYFVDKERESSMTWQEVLARKATENIDGELIPGFSECVDYTVNNVLTEIQRTVILLRYEKRLTLKETAESLGKTNRSTIAHAQKYGEEKIRRALKERTACMCRKEG